MADRPPILLTPVPIDIDHSHFNVICGWPFQDPFVSRLLREDFPQRAVFGQGQIWVYVDSDRQIVGFGTLDVCEEYPQYTSGRSHPYIPLLATNPDLQGRGYGTLIVRHLIAEAALLAKNTHNYHDVIFLYVYTSSIAALSLYRKNGFEEVTDRPIADPAEGGKTYIVMAKSVALTSTGASSSPI